jgi:hypothetical protein
MERFHSLIGIYTIYPISWFLGLSAMVVALLVLYPKIKLKLSEEQSSKKSEPENDKKLEEKA